MSDQEPKPQKINRLDPAWAQFAASVAHDASLSHGARAIYCAEFADAMLRERDRRDREEME